MSHLSIYSDPELLPKGESPTMLLSPFWGDPNLSPSSGHFAYASNSAEAQRHFSLVALADADIAVLPANWALVRGYDPAPERGREEIRASFENFVSRVQTGGKLRVVFFEGDFSYEPISLDCDFVFRTSEFRSRRKPGSFVYPPFCVDLLSLFFDNEAPVREKTTKPRIGFCGYAANPPRWFPRRFQRWARGQGGSEIPPPRWGHCLRGAVLDELARSPAVDTNFVRRDDTFQWSEEWFRTRAHAHAEFAENIVQSDYVICCRGSSNFSCRFYEALCCGRIPVLVETDNVLPFEFAVDWDQYVVRIGPHDHGRIADRILAFHERLSGKEFIALQHACRCLWKDWLSAEGFFSKFHKHFSKGGPSAGEAETNH